MRPWNGATLLNPRGSAIVALAVAMTVPFTQQEVFPAGFAITAQSASASGKSSAFTAQADDASALYFNPAGIALLPTGQTLVGTSVIVPRTSYRADPGLRDSRQANQLFILPQLYISHPFGEQFAWGLGMFTPFGVATDWPKDWEGRFQVTYASVQATVLNPTVAWRPNHWLALAGGIDFAYVLLDLERRINLSRVGEDAGAGPFLGNPEGELLIHGSTTALGTHAGVLITPSASWAVGASFRSRIHAEINDGSADFSIPDPSLQPAFPDGRIRTEIDLPPTVRTGLMVRPKPTWNVEVDAVWTGWSTIDRLVVDFQQGMPVPQDQTPFSWDDSMAYSIGTEYRWAPWIFRAGYTLDFAPIPDETLNPILADGDRHWFSGGVGYRGERWGVDLSYQHILFDRRKENEFGESSSSVGAPPAIPAIDARANGDYSNRVSVVSLTAAFQF